jgi:hypothetical protein
LNRYCRAIFSLRQLQRDPKLFFRIDANFRLSEVEFYSPFNLDVLARDTAEKRGILSTRPSRNPTREDLVWIRSAKVEEDVSFRAAVNPDDLAFDGDDFTNVFPGFWGGHSYGRITAGELNPAKKG